MKQCGGRCSAFRLRLGIAVDAWRATLPPASLAAPLPESSRAITADTVKVSNAAHSAEMIAPSGYHIVGLNSSSWRAPRGALGIMSFMPTM